MKVAVAGAGTAGLAAAIFLSRQGNNVTVYEAIAKADPVGAGFLIQPTGQSVLGKLGLLQELSEAGAQVEMLQGFRGGFRCLNLRYRDLKADFTGLGLHRANLQQALIRQALKEKVKIRFEALVEDFSSGEDGVVFHTSGKEHGTDLLVIADGTRSHLRPWMRVAQRTRAYPWGAFWVICESEVWPHKKVLIQKYGEPWRTAGVLPTGRHPRTGKTCYSIFWSIHRSEFDRYRRDGISLLGAKLQSFWPEAGELFAASTHSNWSVAEYADTRMACWHDNRVVILGDAAHSMSPQLGQGANLALVDAESLAAALAEGGSLAASLQRYSQRRRKHLTLYRWASRLMTPLYQSYWPLGILRDLGTVTLGKIKPLYRQMLLLLSGYKGFRKINP